MHKIWAIILAAGASKRMNTQKLLLPFQGETIIGSVIDNISQSHIENMMVVLGANSNEIQDAIGDRPVQFCHNHNYELGMLSSVLCGFNALPEDADAALVYLGDQPMISVEVTNKVIESYNDSILGIVVPVYENRRGHPLLVDLKYRIEIKKLDLEQGLRALMHHFPQDVLEVEVNVPGILIDIDTKEDYDRATKPK